MKDLTFLDISDCNIHGTIPSEIGSLNSLQHLSLNNLRNLDGTIPNELGNILLHQRSNFTCRRESHRIEIFKHAKYSRKWAYTRESRYKEIDLIVLLFLRQGLGTIFEARAQADGSNMYPAVTVSSSIMTSMRSMQGTKHENGREDEDITAGMSPYRGIIAHRRLLTGQDTSMYSNP